jgi:REP element-mobilizing transposase RayT
MPYRKTKFQAGQVYHLYNRGVNRHPIFFCAENWGFMLRLFRRYFRPDLIDILAYCLMPNHYHLMVRLKVDDVGRQVMQPWGVSYTKAVNKQQNRVGPIFQGPFQAVHVPRDEHLIHLSRYIHLNPVRLLPLPGDRRGDPAGQPRHPVGPRAALHSLSLPGRGLG